MKPTQKLHEAGQSLWLDNITRAMLRDGVLKGYIEELSVTGLTSNPTIFDKAISGGDAYDQQIAELSPDAESAEEIFFELAIADLRDATELFAEVHRRTAHVDGYCSLEVSPKIADDTQATIDQAAYLHSKTGRDNLYVKIPGTKAGLPAIEQSIYAGIPINVTLLFSAGQYRAAAEAYLRGIERRLAAGLDPKVGSVASLFVSRWDVAIHDRVPAQRRNRLGIAIAQRTYKAYRELLGSARWQKLATAGARPQRLLWASTGTKDPDAPDTLYVEALAAPDTVNTMPDKTLKAFAEHGRVGKPLPADGGDAEAVIAGYRQLGIDDAALALQLQREGAASFRMSWDALLAGLERKRAQLGEAAAR